MGVSPKKKIFYFIFNSSHFYTTYSKNEILNFEFEPDEASSLN